MQSAKKTADGPVSRPASPPSGGGSGSSGANTSGGTQAPADSSADGMAGGPDSSSTDGTADGAEQQSGAGTSAQMASADPTDRDDVTSPRRGGSSAAISPPSGDTAHDPADHTLTRLGEIDHDAPELPSGDDSLLDLDDRFWSPDAQQESDSIDPPALLHHRLDALDRSDDIDELDDRPVFGDDPLGDIGD